MERKKRELYPTLKIEESAKDDDLSIQFTEEHEKIVFEIISVTDRPTKFGDKVILGLQQDVDNKFSIFLNAESQNFLIDEFGENDEKWKGKMVKLKKDHNKQFKQDMILVIKS